MTEAYRIQIRQFQISVTGAMHSFLALEKSTDGGKNYSTVAQIHGMASPKTDLTSFVPFSIGDFRFGPNPHVLQVFEVRPDSSNSQYKNLYDFAETKSANLPARSYEFDSSADALDRWGAMQAGAQIINSIQEPYNPVTVFLWSSTLNSNSATYTLALFGGLEPLRPDVRSQTDNLRSQGWGENLLDRYQFNDPPVNYGPYYGERVAPKPERPDSSIDPRVPQRCFAAGTPIRMADGTTRAIEAVGSGDLVMAFDPAVDGGRGALVPKRVTRTFVTPDQPLIDLHGLRVTPGHEFLCGDGRFRTIKDILDSDGTIVNENGEVIRARTGFPIASKEDQVIPVGFRGADGAMCIGYMRAGTPYAKRADDGRVVTIAARMVAEGFHLHADGRFRNIEGDHVTAFWEWGVPDERLFVAPAEVCADFSFVSAEAGGALAHCQVSRTNEGNRAEPRAGISASRKASNTQ